MLPFGRLTALRLGVRLLVAICIGAFLLVAAGASAQSSVEELTIRLASADPRVRRDAVVALGENGSESAVAALAGVAEDPERAVRRAAIGSLAALRRPDAAPVLLRFLEDEERDHRREALTGLVAIHGREAPAGFSTRALNWLMRRDAEFVLDPLRPVDPVVVERIGGRLTGDDDREVRRRAAVGLGALGSAASIAALGSAAASDPDDEVAREAVRSLGELGGEEAGELLFQFLGDDRLRRTALEALGETPHPAAAERLIGIYDEDPEGGDGLRALVALARSGTPLARGTLYHELASRDDRRRAAAAAGIGRLGDETLVDGLIRDFLREEDRRVQLAFCFSLARLGEMPFVDRLVLSLADSADAEVARAYLIELGAPLVDELTAYLDDPDRNVRLALVDLLERLGDPAAAPALEAFAARADDQAAARARLAVRRLRGPVEEGGPPAR